MKVVQLIGELSKLPLMADVVCVSELDCTAGNLYAVELIHGVESRPIVYLLSGDAETTQRRFTVIG